MIRRQSFYGHLSSPGFVFSPSRACCVADHSTHFSAKPGLRASWQEYLERLEGAAAPICREARTPDITQVFSRVLDSGAVDEFDACTWQVFFPTPRGREQLVVLT